jgi:hypothetical protein
MRGGRENPAAMSAFAGKAENIYSRWVFPVLTGGLNRSTQHFILEGKDGVWDGTKIS